MEAATATFKDLRDQIAKVGPPAELTKLEIPFGKEIQDLLKANYKKFIGSHREVKFPAELINLLKKYQGRYDTSKIELYPSGQRGISYAVVIVCSWGKELS